MDNINNDTLNEPLRDENPHRYTYMMLDRLRTDCKYFLGNGNGQVKYLQQLNVTDQIAYMRELWNKLPQDGKPDWISLEQIAEHERQMIAKLN